ncbi:MAG TPA: hypothetical protein VHN36_10340, partial [Ilumatobacteraceae bacterium]|nr:hypothetical protein [Ilumatobacteraceae bacterium]
MTEQIAVREAPESSAPPIEQRAQPNVGDYRYPGVPPFEDSEIDRLVFRGRSKEIDRVLHSILSFDLFLIYAVSGLGKSSLLAAGVAEPLRQRDFFPVTIRLNDPTSSPVALIGEQLREAASKAEGITITRHPAVRDVEGTPSTLWDLLCGLEVWKGNTLQHLVLIFDQFEELFTLGWSAEQRTQFIEQFGQVVRRHRPMPVGRETDPVALLPPPAVKITLVIREDSLGELEAMADCVPQIMRHRFRLDGLTQDQAERAIREPAQVSDPRLRTPQFGFSEGAARAILAFLGARQERGRPVLTGTIDPSQLQIICQHVERSILPNKPAVDADSVVEISEEDLGGKSGLERVLRDFYRRELWTFPVEQRKLVRHLCETGLINQRGRRLSLEEEEIAAKYKLSKATLEALVSHRLLRAEPRVGSVYYELGHDTLAAPILAYRDGVKSARRKRLLGLLLALVAVAIVGAVLWAWSSGNDHASAPTAQPIAIGVPVKGTIPTSGISEFVFDPPENQTLRVNLDPKVSLDATLDVSDPQELPLQANNVVGQAAQSVLVDRTVTGNYRVVVHGQSSRPFTLTVSQVEVVSMAVGDTTLGAVDANHPDAVFEFEALADRALIIEFAPKPGAGLDATLEMIAPDGNPQWANPVAGGVQDVFVDPTVAGHYRVIVNSSKPVRFELTVRQVDVTAMAVGDTKSGTLDAAHPDTVFEFEAADDQPLTIEVTPRPANSRGAATLQVIEPSGYPQSADNGFEGGAQSILVDGTATGTYRVIVHGQSAGDFELTIRQVEAVEISVGDTKSGTIDAAHP